MSDFIGPVIPDYVTPVDNVVSYADNSTKSGNRGQNAANIIGAIVGPGGLGGTLSGVGDIFCSIRGNCQPRVINYNTGTPGMGGMGLFVPILLLIIVVAVLYFLFKK